ncbi:MAG: ubiquinone biosynthesis regulatory protein kinase UbiB [Gammaproteobacteria bacterium]|nr:ubiquinone biosynthesis regulatory protein kinase UbiB [Gammaproteobacteria bacterium]MDH3407165.1 ubiquinone biosynthesis regulatory protein kinase UbiB [Gammaproteobacteria bacterium]MDH3562238.1 ubiquinone biosynthesis regulatory protein kinase UbiB [Gammaproteobacteria bacterium]MDH5486460.1 ubiquinone biosynthesis regulatory protein kinase UbiB [Gammaproteobacteria bacterium]
MMRLRQIGRLLRITQIFVRHDLDEFVTAIHLFRPYRLLLRLAPWRMFARRNIPRGVRLREALEELGPVFVKFGQMLSTRPDLLPEDIADELARLQDRVPPFSGEESVRLIEQALGGKLETWFSEFNREPIASASVAQVHIARLHDGAEVAVKVLRPGIDEVIERDLDLLYLLARLALRYAEDLRRMRPVEVVDEFNKTIHDELDLRVESANASRLRANFEGSNLLYVPKVYWDLTRRTVMVLERIHGIPVSNIEGLKAAGIDMRKLAHNGVEIFFTQAFRHGFFHADMHPGNIFVSPEGQYRAVDFGIMGTLGEKDKRFLAENFLAFFNRDYHAVADAHLRAGWVPLGTRLVEFEAAIRTVCEPVFARPIKEISFGRFLLHLFQTARRFNMEIQPQLVLLQKTLFNIEGLGRRLYPDLDLWETAKPFLERWMSEHMGPRAFLNSLRQEFPKWWAMLPQMPTLMHESLRRISEMDTSREARVRDLEQQLLQMRQNQRRLYFAIAGSGLLITSALWLGMDITSADMWTWKRVAGWTLAAAGAFTLLRGWPR